MSITEQRFLRGPNLWSGESCLQTVVDLGALADTITTDVPGFTSAALALIPGLHRIAGPMRRGCFLAEVLGVVVLEVQKLAGAPARTSTVAVVRGRGSQVRMIVACPTQLLGAKAFDIAFALVKALHAGKRVELQRYFTGLIDAPPIRIRKPLPQRPLPVATPAMPALICAP
jgi:cyanophycin synthetase